jgi:VWFA-related protein
VASNPSSAPAARAFVFVIDDGAIRQGDGPVAKTLMSDFLEQLAPTDRTAIVYVHRSDLGQDFTTDARRLDAAVNRMSTAIGWPRDAWTTRRQLDHAVTALAAAPETRRAIVYLSGGFTVGSTDDLDAAPSTGSGPDTANQLFTQAGLQDLYERAKLADVEIYTLDPSGLRALETNISGGIDAQSTAATVTANSQSRDFQSFLRGLPENTQGIGFTNTSNFGRAVSAILEDNGDYYVLGFSPSPYVADDKFHDVSVRVTSRAGLRVRARRGYVASARPKPTDPSLDLLSALADSKLHSALGLRAFASPARATANGATTVLTLDVSYPATPGTPRADDDLHTAVVAADSNGHAVTINPRALHVTFADRTPEALTLSLDDAIDLPSGRWTLLIGVSSREMGTVGTLRLPVEVPALATAPLALTGLVLGLPPGGPERVAHREAISDLVPLQPTTRRTFTPQDSLRVFVRAFSSAPASLRFELKLVSGAKVVQTPHVTVLPTAGMTEGRDCLAVVPLATLSPGEYILEFIATAPNKRQAARVVGFRVE